MPRNIEMAYSVPLTCKKVKERCDRAQSQRWGWWMAPSSLIVLPSSTERGQISARAEWCVWPLLPSYGVPCSLIWLSLRCTVDTGKERAVQTNSTTERDGETWRERSNETKRKRKSTRHGGGLVWHWEPEKRDLSSFSLSVFTQCR